MSWHAFKFEARDGWTGHFKKSTSGTKPIPDTKKTELKAAAANAALSAYRASGKPGAGTGTVSPRGAPSWNQDRDPGKDYVEF
jgi:hypothetical protein